MVLLQRYGRRFLLAIGTLSVACLTIWVIRVLLTGNTRFSFIISNLVLAWVSLVFAVLLVRGLQKDRWLSSRNILLSVLWLAFLPNTWYVLTDFIHIYPSGEISQLYDIVLISLLVFTGFAIGFASLFLIHRELMLRFSKAKSYAFIEAIVLVASFAIYLGRDLRWNSWDVIANPGLFVNVSDSILDPFGNPRALNVTLLFFTLISLLYFSFWLFTYPAKAKR